MKFLIAYPVWNKVDMVPWLMEGIEECIDPKRADVLFLFTNCTDGSYSEFMANRGILGKFNIQSSMVTGKDLWELDQHNLILGLFKLGKWDAVIVPQDDNRLLGKRLLDDVQRVFVELGDSVGLIGGRDGYGPGYRDMAGSPHSLSEKKVRTLQIGEYARTTMLNTGPLVYGRKVVEKVGLHKSERKIYAMDDYALRCRYHHWLSNVVLGMDVEHRKFGRTNVSEFKPNMAADDLAALNRDWFPVLGHNVH